MATKLNSRPVRMNSFYVMVISSEELVGLNPKKQMLGEYMTKSDVHYCAEKEAIDTVAERINAGVGYEYTYLIYKVSKERDKNDNPKKWSFVSAVYADENTNQIVID